MPLWQAPQRKKGSVLVVNVSRCGDNDIGIVQEEAQ
jgi:hypothetical protein